MTEITPDPARVYIAEIREDLRSGYSEAALDRIREQHIPALLAMVEGVLELAANSVVVNRWRAGQDYAWTLDPAAVREAISRELPGEVPGA